MQVLPRAFMNKIRNGLWISDIQAVAEKDTSHVDRVISVCQDTVKKNVSVPYDHVALADDEDTLNWGGSATYQTFHRAAERALTAFRNGSVLVHCHRGRNRSAAVCAAVLAVVEGWGFHGALARVQIARDIADPNELMRSHGHRFVHDNR